VRELRIELLRRGHPANHLPYRLAQLADGRVAELECRSEILELLLERTELGLGSGVEQLGAACLPEGLKLGETLLGLAPLGEQLWQLRAALALAALAALDVLDAAGLSLAGLGDEGVELREVLREVVHRGAPRDCGAHLTQLEGLAGR
jgi:hypothetical protein